MPEEKELLSSLVLELRRGTIVLGVLSQLGKPMYGYLLVQTLSEAGIAVEANTLYPLLRRLEKQGLLQSEWEVGEAKPRKYYSRTPLGTGLYQRLKGQWEETVATMTALMKQEEEQR